VALATSDHAAVYPWAVFGFNGNFPLGQFCNWEGQAAHSHEITIPYHTTWLTGHLWAWDCLPWGGGWRNWKDQTFYIGAAHYPSGTVEAATWYIIP